MCLTSADLEGTKAKVMNDIFKQYNCGICWLQNSAKMSTNMYLLLNLRVLLVGLDNLSRFDPGLKIGTMSLLNSKRQFW